MYRFFAILESLRRLKKLKKKNSALEKFHREIKRLKEEEGKKFKEKEASGGGGSIHLQRLNPEKLTQEDEVIYNKFNNLELERNDFENWIKEIAEELKKMASDDSEKKDEFSAENSRYLFSQFIANKIIDWHVWEMKKKKKGPARD